MLVTGGCAPDDRVRAHLGACLETIKLTQLAPQLSECDLGLTNDPLKGADLPTGAMRRLSFLIAAHAQTLATDGHYRVVLENYLVSQRMARHVGDGTRYLYLVARSMGTKTFSSLLHIPKDMPSDVDALQWLREQLASTEGPSLSPTRGAHKWKQAEVSNWDVQPGHGAFDRTQALDQARDYKDREAMAGLSDRQLRIWLLKEQRERLEYPGDVLVPIAVPEELMNQACRTYDTYVDSAVGVIDSHLSYGEKEARLDELESELRDRIEDCEPVALLSQAFPGLFHKFMVADITMLNLTKVAVELLLIRGQTAQLPESLPNGLPEDPCYGQGFSVRTHRSRIFPSGEPAWDEQSEGTGVSL